MKLFLGLLCILFLSSCSVPVYREEIEAAKKKCESHGGDIFSIESTVALNSVGEVRCIDGTVIQKFRYK